MALVISKKKKYLGIRKAVTRLDEFFAKWGCVYFGQFLGKIIEVDIFMPLFTR
jgi:hypothetical protein